MATPQKLDLGKATTITPVDVRQGVTVGDLVSRFLIRQSHYSSRNAAIDGYSDLFDGNHWLDSEEPTDEYRLVFNYIRRVILGNVATFSRNPKPRVPIPNDPLEAVSAQNREKMLAIVWKELMKAWYDVELDASKYAYGVIQVLWDPEPGQPQEVTRGGGDNKKKRKEYTQNPFLFRSIPNKYFYPVYRTYRHANDFQEVFRLDPARLVADIEAIYGVKLQGTGGTDAEGWTNIETEPACDLIEYWNKDVYVLLAATKVTYVRYTQAGDRIRRGASNIQTKIDYHILRNTKNKYGRIPFWVVQNIRINTTQDATDGGSLSDMDDIYSLNRHLNHIISEQADEIVTNIHRPLVYKSDDHEQDPSGITMEAGAVYPIGMEEELEPLQWQDEPPVVENHINRVKTAIQDVTFLGEAGFGSMKNTTSGIAARIALTPLQLLVELKVPRRKEVLESIGSFLLKAFEDRLGSDEAFTSWIRTNTKKYDMIVVRKEDIDGNYFVEVDYGNLLPRDDYAFEQGEVYKFKTGVQSLLTTLDNIGFEDPQAEVDRIKSEREDPLLNPDSVLKGLDIEDRKKMQNQPPPGAVPQGPPSPQGAVPGMTGGGAPGGDMLQNILSRSGQQGMGPMAGMMGGGQAGAPLPPGAGMSLPGTAQPGTSPLTNAGPQGNPLTAPPVPPDQSRTEPGQGAGQVTPFLKRTQGQ